MILTHIYEAINKGFCFLSVFLELSKPFFCEIPHSQHVSSNLECADRRKAYFLSFSTRVERKWRNHYIATFSLSTYSLEEFEISWLTYTPIFPMHVFIHELDCLLQLQSTDGANCLHCPCHPIKSKQANTLSLHWAFSQHCFR